MSLYFNVPSLGRSHRTGLTAYTKYVLTLFIIVDLAIFQLLSLDILPPGANRHITAATQLTTAGGGDENDFNSVIFVCKKIYINSLFFKIEYSMVDTCNFSTLDFFDDKQ